MANKNTLLEELTLQREQNKLLLDIIDAIPDPIVAKNWEGNFIFANKACANLYNTQPEKMIGRDDGYFTGNQEQNDFFRENSQSIMTKFKPERVYEDSTDAKSGEIRNYLSHKIPFKDINDKLNIAVIAKDITEITALKNQAELNEKRLNYVLEATQEGIWDWNVETGVVFHNQFWSELVGLDKTKESFSEFESLIHPEDKPYVQKNIEKALNDGQPFQNIFRIIKKDGKTIWVKDRGKVVERNKFGHPTRMVGSVHEVTNEIKQNEEIKQLAFYDSLTGLANRRLLDECLLKSISNHVSKGVFGALLFLDLDNFKVLNDTHGHQMGDSLLVAVAGRLKRQLRQKDFVARFGGDEFVIILDNLSNDWTIATKKAQKIAEKIKKSISNSFSLHNEHVGFSMKYDIATSIGISLFPLESGNAHRHLQLADLALYEAKKKGRDSIVIFEDHMHETLESLTSLELKLKDAISKDKLSLYYQGKFDNNLKLIGAEALVRWVDDDGKMIFPDQFIPLAEESNLIIPIGLNLLEQACNQLSEWSKHAAFKDLSIAVNVSAKQVWHPNFIESFTSVITERCINPAQLTIEITESIMVSDMAETIQKLVALKKLGVKISLDDFGTGYSSMSYLKQLPVDEIKIDASFVRDIVTDPSDLMMVQAILDLGSNFKVGVVAEGVETEEQMTKLQAMNMPSYQGYLLCKPLPIEAFEAKAVKS